MLLGCTQVAPPEDGDGARDRAAPTGTASPAAATVAYRVGLPPGTTTVLAQTSAHDLALATSAALFDVAPVVVLADSSDLTGQARGATAAVALGAPLLLLPEAPLPGDGLAAELGRLGTATVLTVGAAGARPQVGADLGSGNGRDLTVVAAPTGDGDLADLLGAGLGPEAPTGAGDVVRSVAGLTRTEPATLSVTAAATAPPGGPPDDQKSAPYVGLPPVQAADPLTDLVVLATPDPAQLAAVATARATGAAVLVPAVADPRGDPAVVSALSANAPAAVLALGPAFGAPDRLEQRVAVAATGVELPGGGQLAFPARRMVALYGYPGSASLGALGEQPVQAAVDRAREVAAAYAPLSDVPVVPAFEVIATVASSDPGTDGDYSNEADVATLRPWVEAAGAAGMYVVLDLQPGRTDFLTQARRYEELLALPHVGLALDPEWRLQPGQRHLAQIGSVEAAEVNAVIDWLARLTRERDLPQKVLVLHQFRLSMLRGRESIDMGRDEVAVVLHADGNGTPALKYESYRALTATPPPGAWWGWKNFYDEDDPTLDPAATLAVDPSPVFISYQ